MKLVHALRAVGLGKSTYYHRKPTTPDPRRKPLDPVLVEQLGELTGYERTYGYRRVQAKVKEHNHKKVYRHMKALNLLQPKRLKKRHKPRLEISCPIRSDQRWEADLTYVWDGYRQNYLFAVIDAYDKEPIGDNYGLRCRADEAILSLEEAVKTRFGDLEPCTQTRVHLRVDQGSQFIAKKFKQRSKELGIELEFCGINCPDDKPYIESFFSRYKCEEVYRNEYRGFIDAFLGWTAYKQWYKSERIHTGLGYKTIPEFKQQSCLVKTLFWSNNTGA